HSRFQRTGSAAVAHRYVGIEPSHHVVPGGPNRRRPLRLDGKRHDISSHKSVREQPSAEHEVLFLAKARRDGFWKRPRTAYWRFNSLEPTDLLSLQRCVGRDGEQRRVYSQRWRRVRQGRRRLDVQDVLYLVPVHGREEPDQLRA